MLQALDGGFYLAWAVECRPCWRRWMCCVAATNSLSLAWYGTTSKASTQACTQRGTRVKSKQNAVLNLPERDETIK